MLSIVTNPTNQSYSFPPPPPIESTVAALVPQDSSALLSSLESQATSLKAELGVEDNDSAGDAGDLDLQ